jgi:hypothetical protein
MATMTEVHEAEIQEQSTCETDPAGWKTNEHARSFAVLRGESDWPSGFRLGPASAIGSIVLD